jgi:hypothetical protein
VTAVGSAANQMKSVAMVWYQSVSDCSGFCCQSDEVSGNGNLLVTAVGSRESDEVVANTQCKRLLAMVVYMEHCCKYMPSVIKDKIG